MDIRTIKVLVASNHLNNYGGTESYTYALIKELKNLNIDVEYFTFKQGLVSERIEKELNVNFMTKKRYNLILANHFTCVQSLYRKGIIIQTCHGIFPELEQPSDFADIHVSISPEVKIHLQKRGFKSELIYNGIDCDRFEKKKAVNGNIKNVLSLCQSDSANNLIQKICERQKWSFTFLNKLKNGVWEIENFINDADIVIGLGRSAYEAMACGRPVIIFDKRPYSLPYGDGYMNLKRMNKSLLCNCSGRQYREIFDEDKLENEFLKYNKLDGEELSLFIKKNLNIHDVTDKYLQLYFKKNLFDKLFYKGFKLYFAIKDKFFLLTNYIKYSFAK